MMKSVRFVTLVSTGWLVTSVSASALCTAYPNTLTNGTTADASQVMANFNCAALTSGATMNGTTFTGTTTFPGSTTVSSTGALGIGMSPTNILDITQNQNGASRVQISNSNSSGTGATASFRAGNSVGMMEMGVTGSAYGGFNNLIFNMGYISLPGFANGFILGSAGPILFADGSFVEKARFGSDGSFLIGTTINGGWSTDAKIATQGSGSNLITSYNTGTNGYAFTARVDNASAGLISFRYNGATIVGSVMTTGTSTSYNTTSDERLKKRDVPQHDYRANIKDLWVGDFQWKEDKSAGFGIIAQQAYHVFPQAIQKPATPAGPWQADYSKLAPLALWGVKDLYKQTETEDRLIAEQAEEIADLKRRLAKLEALASRKMALN